MRADDELVHVDKKHVRRDAQKAMNNAGAPIYQLHEHALTRHYLQDDIADPLGDEGVFVTAVLAPHLRPDSSDLAWCFSTPVLNEEAAMVMGYPAKTPWVVSTHQYEQHLDHSYALRARALASTILYCVLGNGVGVELCCENEPCVLNKSDSVGEAAAGSLLLCPCCLRKMQLFGFVRDVPACLDKLHALLSTPSIRAASERDLATLRAWGHGSAGSSSDPVPVG